MAKKTCRWSSILILLTHTFYCLGLQFHEDIFCTCRKQAYPKRPPFIAVWNSPTGGCNANFSVPIELKRWDILADPLQHWDSQYVTVFYGAQLGLYPYFRSEDGSDAFNQGLPQLVDLREHLQQARKDIMSRIPDTDYNGLVVIDWEPWRPLWDRNWNSKKIYKTKSIELVRERHPDWSMSDVVQEAKDEFETAARAMFIATIRLGKALRPKAYWGFYGFPDCFGQEKHEFQCTEEVKRSNDKIDWLFKESTALFPSLYLLKSHPENPNYVKGRLRESFRVALRQSQRYGKDTVPIFPYVRSIYMDDPTQFNFIDRDDLYHTIGVASEMGASGVVIWGNRNDENTSPSVCQRINGYIQTTLGPYMAETRQAVHDCSVAKCFGRGTCVHKSHLNTDLKRLYFFRHDLTKNCARKTSEVLAKRGSIPKPQATGERKSKPTGLGKFLDLGATVRQKVSNETRNESSSKSDFGMRPSDEKLNKLQVVLQGAMKANNDLTNSTTRGLNSRLKSEVPMPKKQSSGTFIGNHLKKSKLTKVSLLPHMYVLIIGVSIAGAFLFSLVFVALYYYLNMNPAIKGYKMDRAPTFDGSSTRSKKTEKESNLQGQQQQHEQQQQQQQQQQQTSNQQQYKRNEEESDIEVDLDSLNP